MDKLNMTLLDNYTSIALVRNIQSVPRFGHGKDFSLLFSNTEDRIDYALGTIFIACVIVGFFLLWAVALLVMIGMGPTRVGFLSGFEMKEDSFGLKNGNREKPFKLPPKVYSTFLFSGAVVITCSILLVLRGVQPFLEPLVERNVKDIANEGRNYTDNIFTGIDKVDTIRRFYTDFISSANFCPTPQAFPELANFDSARYQVIYQLSNFSSVLSTDVYNNLTENLFDQLATRSGKIEQKVNNFAVKDWHGLAFSIPLICIAFLMMIGTILSWVKSSNNLFTCLITWILLPIFILAVFLCVLGCAVVSIAAVMNADFCSGNSNFLGPDKTINNILDRFTLKKEYPALYDGFTYIVNKCEGSFPFQFIQEDETDILKLLGLMESFTTELNRTGLDKLSSCGVTEDSFKIAQLYAGSITDILSLMSQSASRVVSLLDCQSLGPIYTNAVHYKACIQYPKSWTWIFASLLGISFFGTIMITLRSSWLPVVNPSSTPIAGTMSASSKSPRMQDSPTLKRRHKSAQDMDDDHENFLSDRYEDRRQNGYSSWEDISVADDENVRSIRSQKPGFRVY